MSLLDNQTKVNLGTSFYALAGSGGGGGGGGGTVSYSTINMTGGAITGLSTITASPGGGNSAVSLSGEFFIFTKGFGDENSGFEVYNGGGNNTVANVDFDSGAGGQGTFGARGYSTISGTQQIDALFSLQLDNLRNGKITLNHEYSGVSTMSQINMKNTGDLSLAALSSPFGGANTSISLSGTTSTITFGPQGAVACHSKIPVSTNTYVPQAGTTQNLGAWPSEVGHLYDVRLPVRIDAVSQPAAGDWAVIGTDTATANVGLATLDLVQVSSVANQYELHLCGSVIASGTTTTLTAIGKPSAGTSTAVTVTGSAAFIRDLGIPQNF